MKKTSTTIVALRAEQSYLDKSTWGDGPWQKEPDKIHWRDDATGLHCLIVRSHMGNLCGYVGVPRNHPAYKKDYDSIDVNVHGGLTYASRCAGNICHIVEPGEDDDVWWLGFDCAHYMDYIPGMKSFSSIMRDGSYRDVSYVKSECERLAQQLAEAKNSET